MNSTFEHIKEKIRFVEVRQNSWEQENISLLTTLNDEEIKKVLQPLVDEEREADGDVIYDNDVMVQMLSETYPNDIVISYSVPDDLEL